MSTRTKPKKSKRPPMSPASSQEPARRGFPRPRGRSTEASGRRPGSSRAARSRPSGLIERVQASLPGGKAPPKKNASIKAALSKFASTDTTVRTGKPSKTRVAGIVAGAGLGAAAVAKSRRGQHRPDPAATPEQPTSPPVQPNAPVQESAPAA